MPLHYDDRMPLMRHMIHLRLPIPWHGMQRLYLQLRDEQQMKAWVTDLQRRAHEDSSAARFREQINEQANQSDPSLAVGMLAVRKARTWEAQP